MNLRKVITEALIAKKVISDCNCGCKASEKCNKAPILNESIAPREILSEGLKYHIDNNKPLTEHLYRAGSKNYFNLWSEARALYVRNVLDFSGDDLEILTETHLGEFGIFEGKKVPLDFPIELTEEEIDDTYFIIQSLKTGSPKYIANIEGEKPLWVPDSRIRQAYKFATLDDAKNYILKFNPKKTAYWHIYKRPYDFSPKDVGLGRDFKSMVNEAEYKGKKVPLDFIMEDEYLDLNEEKKKNPPLNKPKRGGSKAYYVYVKDPKTKRIKKVSFGSGGLKAKINNPKARQAFAKRHRCSEKNDKTKASYWSCRLPRYAKLLGLKSNFSGFW